MNFSLKKGSFKKERCIPGGGGGLVSGWVVRYSPQRPKYLGPKSATDLSPGLRSLHQNRPKKTTGPSPGLAAPLVDVVVAQVQRDAAQRGRLPQFCQGRRAAVADVVPLQVQPQRVQRRGPRPPLELGGG